MQVEAHHSVFARANYAEQELGDFSAIVAHDLAASLRHIATFSELLLRDLGPNATIAQTAYGDHIHRAAQKCGLMMDQLYVYAQVQQKPLAFTRCDVTRLVRGAAEQLDAEARAAKAEIAIGPLGEQFVDPDLITLVFKHALSNAIKFRHPGVAPRIAVRRVETPGAWVVHVADNGMGMALERQEKMFGMFYRDNAEDAFPGVGAGLALSRRVLRRHLGSAQFVECPDGACLEIRLPPVAGQTPIHGVFP